MEEGTIADFKLVISEGEGRRGILRLRPDLSAQRGQKEKECRDFARNDCHFLGARGSDVGRTLRGRGGDEEAERFLTEFGMTTI